jgi:hypothetical protein
MEWQQKRCPDMLAPDVKSAFRTLQVLEFFSETQQPARVNDIHRELGAPQSSTSKLLGSLARRGYLEYDAATHTYFPTLRVTMLGNWLHERWFESRSLMAVASELRSEFGTSVILGVQNDTWAMYILALPALTAADDGRAATAVCHWRGEGIADAEVRRRYDAAGAADQCRSGAGCAVDLTEGLAD